jgi:hypothetical protein
LEALGRLHTSDVRDVLTVAWTSPFSTKSNFAREFADEIAMAASLGWITSQGADRRFGRCWYVTPEGLAILKQLEWQEERDDETPEADTAS